MRVRLFHIALLLSMVVSACAATGNTWRTSSNAHNLTLSLDPLSAEYPRESVSQGAVRFTATLKNGGDQQLTVAHPSICVPADYVEGSARSFDELHGKSEIVLRIRKPDGTTLILRDGPYFFDPGLVSHFTIETGQTKQFALGWFFQNARGRWENSPEADVAFLKKGRYSVQLLFRNILPRAYIYDRKDRVNRNTAVWTGEAVSNVVEVTIN